MAHSAICTAIVNRDEDEAARAMLDHLEDSKARLASVLVLPLSRHVLPGPAEEVQE
jgi:DNA-binding FadR family transcriptional regulator